MIIYSPDQGSPYSIGTVATFSCLDGFILEGSPNRLCGGDDSTSAGTWSGVDPVCRGACVQLEIFSDM